ncbi:MAG: hypothetical protein PVI07_10835 [Anaerolineae bacterium]|jgi:hypothetical protein
MTSIRRSIDRVRGFLQLVTQQWKLALLLIVLLLVFSVETPPPASMEARVNQQLAGERFDFVGWEFRAVWKKVTHGLVSPQRFMNERDRRNFLLDYLALVGETQRLEGEINRVYADPAIEDADAATADLRAQRRELRAEIRERQLLAEAILQEQVASVLEDEGFGALGQELPPVEMHFTPLPQLLIVSPRDRIERIYQLSLTHGLGTAERETIEEEIDATFDVSSLITGIGGLSAYPSMLLESSSLNWVTEVTAHEWTHHYLTPRPLGRNYLSSPETRTINETVASIVGKEVGRKVVARYYPEHLPPEPEPKPEPEEPAEEEPAEPPEFDFRMEMRETRIRADELLAAGEVDEAEAYMERRREVFVANGYIIRKLNQAYFAFHGAYADQPGAAGEDPIGPAVQELFARSTDLHTFVNRVAGVTTLDQLEMLLSEIGSQPGLASPIAGES